MVEEQGCARGGFAGDAEGGWGEDGGVAVGAGGGGVDEGGYCFYAWAVSLGSWWVVGEVCGELSWSSCIPSSDSLAVSL